MKKVSPIRLAAYSGFTLILVYLFYYLKKVDVSLTYSWQQTIPLSFMDSLKIPGGISKLLADLILEGTSQPLLGSIMMALLLVIVFISLITIFRKDEGKVLFHSLVFATLIPFILLFAHYRLPFGMFTSIVTALLLGTVQSYYLPRNLGLSTVLNFLAALVVYIISGIPGLLVLLQIIIIQSVYSKKYLNLVSALPLLTIPLLYLPFNLAVSIKQAYLGSFLVSKYDAIPLSFYISLSSPLLLLLVFSFLAPVFSNVRIKQSLLISLVSIPIVLAGMIYSTLRGIHESEKLGHAIVKASFNKDWDQVIELTTKASAYNKLVQFEANRALYGTGQLLDNLFNYPQKFGENGIFLDGFSSSYVAIHTAAFYYDLGFANEARHWATEAQMVLVRHPVVLKQLVMTYIAIGQEETALKYLRVLAGSRLYQDWCNHVTRMLENNEAGDDPDIKFFRSNNPPRDFFAGTKDPVQKQELFYLSKGNNKMAFDFLVASYLLQHNIGHMVSLLPEFKKYDYEKFPRAVEEAMMIYLSRSGSDRSLLSQYSISKSTVDRFRDFSELIANVESQAERMSLVSEYKNTYWYYILFTSPYATKK